MKKFFKMITNGIKKFFGFIKRGIKKIFDIITNKWLLKGATTILLVAIVIAGYIGVNWGAKQLKVEDLDFTTKKLYSLSNATKDRLKNLDEDIIIQLINMDEYSYVIEYADKYENVSDKITIEQIDDLSARVDLQTKYNISTTDNLIVVKNGDREKTLTTNDLYTYDYTTYEEIDVTEEAITNAIVEVTIDDKPNIYVLEGKAYNEPEQSLGIIATQLIKEANNMELFDILTKGSVPEDCDCLVITTLKQDLSDFERDKILEYIDKGGNLLLLTSQNILEVDTPNFDKVLAQYGITLGYGAVLEQDTSKMLYNTPNMIVAEASASFMSKIDMAMKLFLVSPGSIKFADEAKLEELGVTYETIATTSESSFVRTDFNQSTTSRTDKDSEIGSNIVAAHATKNISEDTVSELMIYSDETFASTAQLVIGYQYISAVNLYNNQDVVLNSVYHLIERDDTITIRKTDEVEKYTVTDKEDVIIKTIIFVVPVLIIGAGVVVWMLRRRKI